MKRQIYTLWVITQAMYRVGYGRLITLHPGYFGTRQECLQELSRSAKTYREQAASLHLDCEVDLDSENCELAVNYADGDRALLSAYQLDVYTDLLTPPKTPQDNETL